jgi:hypothetical protein
MSAHGSFDDRRTGEVRKRPATERRAQTDPGAARDVKALAGRTMALVHRSHRRRPAVPSGTSVPKTLGSERSRSMEGVETLEIGERPP